MSTSRFNVELRARVDEDTIFGHAAVFGQVANLGSSYEQLHRDAFNAVLEDPSTDVRALINHDPNQLLARQSSGTLRLQTDNEGLSFEIDLPDTSYARDLRSLVARGDLDGASFGFVPGDDEWDRAPDGRRLRTHTRVARLIDISPVTFPAYEGAGVALRRHEFEPVSRRRTQMIHARHRARTGGIPRNVR